MTPWMTSTRFSGVTVERISCRASARKLRSVDVSCVRGTCSMSADCRLCQRAGQSANKAASGRKTLHNQTSRVGQRDHYKVLRRVGVHRFNGRQRKASE